ncbi:MAG TPA: hypothetical protein VHC22_19830 [Pirellulales bacterium]|nr:hypothetical protein [Pirellulales bacterium]
MSKKEMTPASRPSPPRDREPARAPSTLSLVGFLVFAVGYLVLYLGTKLADLGGSVTRFELLTARTLLPEQAAARWFGDSPLWTLSDRLPVLVVAAGIVGLAWLSGRLLLAALRVDPPVADEKADGSDSGEAFVLTRLEHFLFSTGVGLNTVSLYVLAVGLAGRLTGGMFFVPAVVIVALACWQAGRRRNRIGRTSLSPADDGITAEWLWLAAPFVAAILLGGVLPPVDFDVREYHLQAPKEFFQRGKIEFLRHNVYGNMPLGSEMFSLLAMVACGNWWLGALAGKTVIATFGPLTALALFAAGRRFASSGAGTVAAVLYLSIPWIAHVSTTGLIEGALGFYLFLSLYAVLLWRECILAAADTGRWWNQRDACLAVAGLCSGGAVSCKYPAMLFVVLPLMALICASSGKRCWRPVVIYSIALIAACGLWFAKNWVLTGNPVYPLLYEWLGGATRTADKNDRWGRAHLPHEFGPSALANSLSAVALKSSWLSPILLPLAVVGLAVRRYRRLAIALGGYFVFVIAAWWLFTHRIDRFWVPALPVVALLAGLGAVWSVSLVWRRIVLAYVVVGLAISFVYITSPEFGYSDYFVSLPTTRRDTDRVNPWYLTLNDHVPPGSTVLSVGDAQVFDIDPPVLYNTAFDDNLVAAIFADRTPEQMTAELRRRNVSHVFVNWSEIHRYRSPGNYGGIPDFITPEWFAGLVDDGLLERPWQHPLRPSQEIYPVRVAERPASDGALPIRPAGAGPLQMESSVVTQ